MKRDLRLRKSTDFRRVRRLGRSYAHPLMVLVTLPNELQFSRFGVTAGKSIGTAVARNRAKRLLRAAASAFYQDIQPGWDIVLIARSPLPRSDIHQASSVLLHLLGRAKLFRTPESGVQSHAVG